MKTNFKIAMIDDDSIFVDSIKDLLEGYSLEGFNSSSEGLDALKKNKYNILILDYYIDELNGSEVVKKIRAFDKEIYILMLTGYSEDIPALKALKNMDIQDYYEKDSNNIEQLIIRVEAGIKAFNYMKTNKESDKEEGFPQRLKILRTLNRELQEALAEVIGVSRSTIGSYEAGKSEPDIETMKQIATHYNVSMDYLLGFKLR